MPSPLIELLEQAQAAPVPIAAPAIPLVWAAFPQDLAPFEAPPVARAKRKMRLEPLDHLHKPSFEPKGESLFGEYMGLELEVEVNAESLHYRNELVFESNILLNGNDPNFCVFKKDGSLKFGFEICTRPASLEYHREKWKEFFSNPIEGLTVSNRCGIHIHLSKNAMTSLQIGKIIEFIHSPSNRKFIQKIAQRGSLKHCNFALDKNINHALKKYIGNFSHYSPVNLLNRDTVEIRIFAGSISLPIILKNLEFCHALMKFTFPGAYSIADSSSVEKFLEFVKKNRLFYPNLVNFLAANGHSKTLVPVKDSQTHRKIR